MISRAEAERALSRMMKSGVIARMPKNPADVKLLLALAASFLLTRHRYSEAELNDQVIAWLDGFTCPVGIDHVTFRRYLVDFGFLDRDAKGSFYLVNGAVTSSVLEPQARSIAPKDIYQQLQADRAARKRRFAAK